MMTEMTTRIATALLLGAGLLLLSGCAEKPRQQPVILATTTSTQDTGLLDALLPLFEQRTGYRVKTIAVGTGEALKMGRRGDADVLLTHAPEREKGVVAEGYAINRRLVMHNDFLIVGPPDDPVRISGSEDGSTSLARIARAAAPFVSRGDDSGTHIRELSLWDAAGVDPGGEWYISAGQGMGATLMVAAEKQAYVLTDRATYLAMRGRTSLVPHVEHDPRFLNIYSVMEVNPERFPGVNHDGAAAFSKFLCDPEVQGIIGEFGVEQYGQPLFFPDAGKSEDSLAR
jgi:tungstate transport system substrate-binding protein